jgi:SAM-dependent methyltransferase
LSNLSTRPPEIPAAVMDRMIRLAEIPHSTEWTITILDPAAGTGKLIRRIRKAAGPDHIYEAYEPDEARWRKLRGIVGDALNADFLTLHGDLETAPDRILMAPPASAYAEYVRHAWGFLAPGGRLVALVPVDFPTMADGGLRRLVREHGRVAVTGDRCPDPILLLDRPANSHPDPYPTEDA